MHCPLCLHTDVAAFAQVNELRYYRCVVCKLTFLDSAQMPDRDTEYSHYEMHTNDVDDVNYRAFLRRLTHPLLEKISPGSYGLDFGCGPGPALAAMLGERGHVMEMYDPFYAADEDVLEEQYDFITCTEAVEHFHEPAKEFERFDRMLKPGGWLGIMTSLLNDDIDFCSWHYRRDPTHVCFYSRETFKFWCRKLGWRSDFPREHIVLMQKPDSAENSD